MKMENQETKFMQIHKQTPHTQGMTSHIVNKGIGVKKKKKKLKKKLLKQQF